MVSYAAEGGSIGPHVDNYDVFLLQVQPQDFTVVLSSRCPRMPILRHCRLLLLGVTRGGAIVGGKEYWTMDISLKCKSATGTSSLSLRYTGTVQRWEDINAVVQNDVDGAVTDVNHLTAFAPIDASSLCGIFDEGRRQEALVYRGPTNER